jgi:hypothetical protein
MKAFLFITLITIVLVAGCIGQSASPQQSTANANRHQLPTKTYGPCESIKVEGKYTYEKDSCYFDIATGNEDPAYCEQIIDSGLHDNCMTNISIGTNNVSLCNSIINSDWGDNCYSALAVPTNNTKWCEKIMNGDRRDYCYLYMEMNAMTNTSTPSICEKITNSTIKGYCYEEFYERLFDVFNNRDPSLCEHIQDSLKKNTCYSYDAQVNNDTALCEHIVNNEKSTTPYICIYDVVHAGLVQADIDHKTYDTSQCEKLTNSTNKEYCYEIIVTYTHDSSLCNKLGTETLATGFFKSICGS